MWPTKFAYCLCVVVFLLFLLIFLGLFCILTTSKHLCNACANCIIWIFLYGNTYMIATTDDNNKIEEEVAVIVLAEEKEWIDRSIIECSVCSWKSAMFWEWSECRAEPRVVQKTVLKHIYHHPSNCARWNLYSVSAISLQGNIYTYKCTQSFNGIGTICENYR